MLRALLFSVLLVTACTDTPVDVQAQRRCLAVPDSTIWHVVDTAAYQHWVRRCLRP